MANKDLNNSYWAQKLTRFKDGSRLFPALAGGGGGIEQIEIQVPESLCARLSRPVYIAALGLMAAKYSAKDEVVVAEPSFDESGSLSPLFYSCEARGEWSAGALLASVAAEIEAAREHQPYSFEALAALLGVADGSLFQLSFSSASEFEPHLLAPRRGLSVSAAASDGREARLRISYDADCFSQSWIEQFGRHYLRALSFLTDDRSARLCELDLLSAEEKRRVAALFNRTEREYPDHKTLHRLIEESAARHSDSIAVVFEGEEMTYGELNEKANRLAHFLRERLGVETGDTVGVMLRRSEKMAVALLAAMKAGAAYVPINPRHPWATLSYMIENARIKALVVDSECVSQASTFSGELFVIDVELDALDTAATNPGVEVSSRDLAYVIYTSGSTGKPKGVAVEHRAIVNTILWRNDYYGFDEKDANLQMPSFAFDSSVLDIFCVLAAGGRLIIPDEDLRLDANYLKETILRHRVTRLILTPSYYRVLMRELGDGATLRSITVAGESTTLDLVEEHAAKMPGVVLYNEYGPTENAVCSTACALRAGAKSVAIGRPIHNVKVFIMDQGLKLLPAGAPGEIFLGGSGLARGYLNNEALTAERFIASPIEEFYTGRLYRTGDWGYWTEAGELEFLGRVDNQVKVRGFRIELDEIESRLSYHPSVESAAVVCKGDGGDKYIAAYVVSRDSIQSGELRGYLSNQLPYYMVPEVITLLPELPLNLNGKVDRAMLKRMNDRASGGGDELPGNGMESAIAAICFDLLQRSRLGANDNFFDHGFNSLKVMEMVSRIRNELDIDVSLLDVYTFPSIKALSRRIGAERWKSEMIKTESTI